MMKLYMVHCGFYDKELCHGIYESHVNFFVVAEDFKAAKIKVKSLPEYIDKKMHVDGLQEITAIDGYQVNLLKDDDLKGKSKVSNFNRD